jgi:phenylacetate-CoA ligase
MDADPQPTDLDRYPTLTPAGQRLLSFLKEHPHAPIYRNESGNRLLPEEVARVRAFESEVAAAAIDWRAGEPPRWLEEFTASTYADVPHYRRQGVPPVRFEDIPSISRADLSRDIAAFVPDSVPVERMINFRTSGTSGHPLLLASHPVVAASYLTFHKRALRRVGITLLAGAGEVGVVLIGHQKKCFTYVSVTPTMNEAGLAKINLHPDDWRDPEDRTKYLDDLKAEVYTGDPISFAELLTLPVTWRPRALLSTSMTLLPGLRQRLEARFQCPVLDLYSMNEAGPIAVADPNSGGHVLLQPRMYVEILDDEDRPLPPGERGEVTLTGGFNFCLPLLRYRTGDHAALDFCGPEPVLVGLQGRPPVRYRTASGSWINNIEITHALRPLALPQWTVHQGTDGAVTFRHAGMDSLNAQLRQILQSLLGDGLPLCVEQQDFLDGKVIQYTSDLTDPATK